MIKLSKLGTYKKTRYNMTPYNYYYYVGILLKMPVRVNI